MNSLEVIANFWQNFCATQDALTIASKVIVTCETFLLTDTEFLDDSPENALQIIKASRSAASDYAILSMWAIFERTLISIAEIESQKMLWKPALPLTIAVQQKVSDNIEYWKPDEMLNLCKIMVDGNLIGQAKQIKHYRDWVAHKNPKKGSPAKVTAETAYTVLISILKQLDANMHTNNVAVATV